MTPRTSPRVTARAATMLATPRSQARHDARDYLMPSVSGWLSAAAATLDRHISDSGICRRCDQAWPCDRALAAAFVLDAF